MEIPPKLPPTETGSSKPTTLPSTNSRTEPPPLSSRPPATNGFFKFLKYGFISILALFIGVVLIVGLIKHFNPPEKSMAALQAAIKRHDRKSVETYVDAPALATSMRKFMRDVFELQDEIKAKQNTNEFIFDRFLGILVKPIGDKIVNEMIDHIVTPDNLLAGMSGESVSGIMKKSLTGMSDDLTDASMKLTDPKTQVYAPAIKLALGFCADALVDQADAERAEHDSKPQGSGFDEKDVKTITLYEASNRYVVMYKTPNPDLPIIALVYERHGLTVWKWSEMRLLPPDAAK